jgi:signal transduction histidine kinase/ligand-binding sensor domain-containing protein
MLVVIVLFLLQVQNFFTVEERSFSMPDDSLISTSWTVEEGLPVNAVNEIIQDSTGYLWITTYDGVVRFDGLNFKTYTSANTDGMPQNRAVYLLPQSGDILWITLENGGVLLKDGEKFTHFNEDDGFTNSNVTHIAVDRNGDTWFASLDGVHKYRNGEFQSIFRGETNLENQVNLLYEDFDGSFWFATADGLVHFNSGKIQHFFLPNSADHFIRNIHRTPEGELLLSGRSGVYIFSNGEITSPSKFDLLDETLVHRFIETKQQKIYIPSSNGLYKYENGSLILIEGNENRESPFIYDLEDSTGKIWLVNDDGEVYLLENDQLAPFVFPEGEKYHINMITEDSEGNFWFTTARSGIVRVKTAQVQTITSKHGLGGNNILGMFEDRDGNYWVGTRDEGLNKISGNTITSYYEDSPPLRNIVHSINQDPEGNIWVGYYNEGLVKFDHETGNYSAYRIGATEQINDVRSIYFRRDSSMWIATYGGLVKFDPEDENHTYYTIQDGLGSNLIRYMDEDENGALWLATVQSGVSRFKDGEFTSYTVDDGLASNNIRSVYVDEFDEGTVWVGTETNGISRIRDGEIRSLGTQEGLPDHVIHYISQDSLGYLWMSSNRGIIKLKKERLNDYLDGKTDSFDMIHFDRSDGMVNPEANGTFQQGGIRTSDGYFWFATQEGVAIFPVQPNQRNTVPPTVILKKIEADGNIRELPKNGFIELRRGTNNFTIDFHALTYTSPEKTQFRYRLNGLNDEWTEVYNERTVTFSNVPAGTYTFQLLSANNHGVWNTTPTETTIIVTDHFYNQWWFYPAIFLLIFLGYIPAAKLRYRYLLNKQKKMQAIIKQQTAQLRKEKEELEKRNEIIEKQSEQLRELNRTKDKFFSIIAHDLRNPFQAILGFTEILIEDTKDSDNEEFKHHLEQIDIAGRRVFNLLENLLKWASLQTGRIKSKPEVCNLKEIIRHTKNLLEHQAIQKDISIITNVHSDITVFADSNMLRTILQNLVSNAIKFSEKGSEIEINVTEKAHDVTISVSDEGIGIPKKMLKRLMKLDANTSRSGTSEEKGSGLGLIISKEMINIQNGSLLVESTEGKGTTFTIVLPKNHKHPT